MLVFVRGEFHYVSEVADVLVEEGISCSQPSSGWIAFLVSLPGAVVGRWFRMRRVQLANVTDPREQ